MNHAIDKFAIVSAIAVAAAGTMGCGSKTDSPREGTAPTGSLGLPLQTQGASGTAYRLRNAEFVIDQDCWDYGWGGAGNDCPDAIVVNGEDHLDEESIQLSVEEGYYNVRLSSGWEMEERANGNGNGAIVEATLLSSSSRWIYVSRNSTRWVDFEFGIGERSIWMNGRLNIEMTVYEDPSDLYGYAGAPGTGGTWGQGGSAW